MQSQHWKRCKLMLRTSSTLRNLTDLMLGIIPNSAGVLLSINYQNDDAPISALSIVLLAHTDYTQKYNE